MSPFVGNDLRKHVPPTARTNLAASKSILQKNDQNTDLQDMVTVSDYEEDSKESKDAANSAHRRSQKVCNFWGTASRPSAPMQTN